MTGSPGHGWAVFAAMFVLFAAGFTAVYWAEAHPHPLIHGAAQTATPPRPAATWKARRSATASPKARSSPPSPPTQAAARSTACTTASRPSAAWFPRQHHARRSHLRRRRLRPLRHADLRRPRGLHRRPDGGPHAGVPGQKDRSLRREDVHALRAHLPARHSLAHRDLRALAQHRASPRSTTPAPTASPKSSTPSPPARATTARPSPASMPTPGGTTSRSAGTCSSAASS